MTFGSLFSGIGGIDLGLERAGMKCQWQVEIDPFCRKVLAKHWPNVERYEDVRAVGSGTLGPVDVIAGGFPCQDVSVAGKKAGIKEGTRSGLWFEFHRIICELRPRYVFVENVPGLLTDGMGRVLSDLAESGYDAEWEVLSAADVGAPHLRKRVFIVAYPNRDQQRPGDGHGQPARSSTGQCSGDCRAVGEQGDVAHTDSQRLQGSGAGREVEGRETTTGYSGQGSSQHGRHWAVEPNVGRVAHGVPKRVDRLKGLGNAVGPQCAEWIGRKILSGLPDFANEEVTSAD
jgi:DNA (cytosine-5)-methyltransferase 1